MQLQPYVAQVQSQLVASAALGDDRTKQTAEVLAAASEPALRLAILAAVGEAADEITAALLDTPGSPSVSVRLDGDELRIETRSADTAETTPAPADESDASARISLRLSEALKSEIDAAARAAAVSVNTWLIRTAAGAVSTPRASASTPTEHTSRANQHRITGWVNG